MTCARLWLQVQADALAADPAGYILALAWRARGLRVRSRNKIAALAGRSASAYAFWIACREPGIRSAAATARASFSPPILIVVDCRSGSNGLPQTLQSLPAAASLALLGGPSVDGARAIERPADLGDCLDGDAVWICAISCGDRLATDALDFYRAAIDDADTELVYSDDDLLAADGARIHPHFKPDWNAELFQHHDFLTGSMVARVRRADLEGLPDDGWAEALARKVVRRGAVPLHLPYVLHHRLSRPAPIVPEKPLPAVPQAAPLVTVVIPTRNRADLLRTCVSGVQSADYPALEIIIVDNGSSEPEAVAYLSELAGSGVSVIRIDGPFNYSVLNNAAVAIAQGELVCLLNNDVEMLEPDWLALLVRQAMRPEIGAVGARLLYPDGTVQHAGVFTGIGGGAGHGHRLLGPEDAGYFQRARLPQSVSAVTAACLVVERRKFLSVGGLDEKTFPVAFNDVDLCLKLNARGWQSFYEPRATLIHHESKSRGNDREIANRARFAEELAALKRKWRTDERRDPFHHPHLSPFCEQFMIAV